MASSRIAHYLGSVRFILACFAIWVLGNMPMTLAEENSDPRQVAFEKGVAKLRTDALASGIPAQVFDDAFKDQDADLTVIDNLENQPEHVRAVWDYIDRAVSETRIAQGRAKLKELAPILGAIEKKYQVDRTVLVAVWGLESAYGTGLGSKNVIRSLATLAVLGGRRARFGKSQLMAALKILQSGDVKPDGLLGSWAGAMGHTQFIPTTYLAHAVDFDGDGKRNIWTSVADALASTANYLKLSGWRADRAWGGEVKLPPGFDYALSGYGHKKTVKNWAALGVKPVPGQTLAKPDIPASLILPAGANGPAFLITRNFRAILRYNNATAYALAVAHLSDRLNNKGPIVQKWPLEEPPLGRADREELQKLLNDAGFSTGDVDGIIGSRTRQAVQAYQRSKNLPEDGYPSIKLLDLLRAQVKS